MNWILAGVAVGFFVLGFYVARDGQKQGDARRCPKCNHRRLLWCRGCGLHFDDDDEAISHRDYERMTAPDVLFEDPKNEKVEINLGSSTFEA